MLELLNISKSFGDLLALDRVCLAARPGTIHGLVGENGAGKSTLMKILTGFISASGGYIRLNGEEIQLTSPEDASALGFGMLYQEPLDFPQLSVLENFMAGDNDYHPTPSRDQLSTMCIDFGFTLDPDEIMGTLTLGERQQLELLRLAKEGKQLLILDEPTTGISTAQRDALFSALATLRDRGAIIFLVTHKLEEIELLCDSVTVLRQGVVTGVQHRPFQRSELLLAMFAELPQEKTLPVRPAGQSMVLTMQKVNSDHGRCGLQACSVTINNGEIIGLAGVDGSGQSVFLKLACGLIKPRSGEVSPGSGLQTSRPYGLWSTKVNGALLPADRLSEGLFPELSIHEHLLLVHSRRTLLLPSTGRADSQAAIQTFAIKGTPETSANQLSGGNQQRLLLSLVDQQTRLICLENPTRGLDIHAAQWTWQYLHQLQENGATLLFASPDLDEILAHATRILVFFNGTIILDTPKEETSFGELSQAITGPGTVAR